MYHKPIVSNNNTIIAANIKCEKKDVENVYFRFSKFPFPKSNVRNLEVLVDKVILRKAPGLV